MSSVTFGEKLADGVAALAAVGGLSRDVVAALGMPFDGGVISEKPARGKATIRLSHFNFVSFINMPVFTYRSFRRGSQQPIQLRKHTKYCAVSSLEISCFGLQVC
jgi:hypothetical protein